jgi:hypothetical protein
MLRLSFSIQHWQATALGRAKPQAMIILDFPPLTKAPPIVTFARHAAEAKTDHVTYTTYGLYREGVRVDGGFDATFLALAAFLFW